jgi:hypothetical protein
MAPEQPPSTPPTRWLELTARYEGYGKAEFTDPAGVVEGPAVVEIDRQGRQRVTIDVEKPPPLETFFYVKGQVAAADFRRHGMFNPCASVTVQTAQGLFSASERVLFTGWGPQSRPNRIRLRPLRSLYEVTGTDEPAYWVLPLCNFVSACWPWSGEDLAKHPLRVRGPARQVVAAGAEADQPITPERLIVFEIDGQTGFIEPLPGYDRLVRRLRRGRIDHTVTAVMVAPAHVRSVVFSDARGLFPLDVLGLLTLATGVRVGAPWVEFRDITGRLVRRVHIPFGARGYERGHAALSDLAAEALGMLLTSAFCSPERGASYLRAVTHLTIDASFARQTLETRLVSLIRAFETLCCHHGLGTQDLMSNLDATQQSAVRTALTAAAVQVRNLARTETDPARARAVDRIASRVESAAQRENDFGLAVIGLLRRLGLSDADVLQSHLASHPVAGATNWGSLLSCLRGAVTHEAFFDLPANRYDLYELVAVMDHLHDLLLRVIFKTLGYAGCYSPPIPPEPRFALVDWVTPSTSPGLLGYH